MTLISRKCYIIIMCTLYSVPDQFINIAISLQKYCIHIILIMNIMIINYNNKDCNKYMISNIVIFIIHQQYYINNNFLFLVRNKIFYMK